MTLYRLRFLLLCICNNIIAKDYNFIDNNRLLEIHRNLNYEFDRLYPPFRKNITGNYQNYHSKRCNCQEGHQSITDFIENKWARFSYGYNLLVHSTCLGSDSFGNYLGMYFEVISCARFSGMHYMAVAKIWEPGNNHKSSPFIDKLPSIIENPLPFSDGNSIKSNIKRVCSCTRSCHEYEKSLWIKNLIQIKSILSGTLAYHLSQVSSTDLKTRIGTTDTTRISIGEILPFIPDVAIHYRCGDNFVGYYGFLLFSAFLKLIPTETKTIYIMAERRSRKTSDKTSLAKKCDGILNGLFNYLSYHRPQAKILLRRGDDLYFDFARLAYAKILICSVSTFCLWPAIMNNGTAYFPLSKLIVNGNKNINLGFKWLTTPPILLGSELRQIPLNDILLRLRSGSASINITDFTSEVKQLTNATSFTSISKVQVNNWRINSRVVESLKTELWTNSDNNSFTSRSSNISGTGGRPNSMLRRKRKGNFKRRKKDQQAMGIIAK